MPRGPAPQATRRRTNAPTIPTTNLPVGGREGPPPKLPPGVKLGKVGKAFWRWVWNTPQAAAWSPGHEAAVARRASLEDDLAALDTVTSLDLAEMLMAAVEDDLKALIQQLAGLATGRKGILQQIDALDDRLGLNPKAMVNLRWTIKGDAEAGAEPKLASVSAPADGRWGRRTG